MAPFSSFSGLIHLFQELPQHPNPWFPPAPGFFWNRVNETLERGSKTKPNHCLNSLPSPVPKSHILNNSRDGNSTRSCPHSGQIFPDIWSKLSSSTLRNIWERSPLDRVSPWLYLMQVWVFFTQFIICFFFKDVYFSKKAKIMFFELFHLFLLFNPGMGIDPVVGFLLWWAGNNGKGDSLISEGSLTAFWTILCGFAYLVSRRNNQ